MARRFVPFGSHWAMGIDVPYSLGVIDHGQFWCCGQCPLDLQAAVLAPGDLPAQLAIVADLIRKQFSPHGITTSSIAKLVAYVDGDAGDLADTQRILRDALSPVPLVVAIGVPPFYYPGMRVEIDAYGAEDSSAVLTGGCVRTGDLVHLAGPVSDVEVIARGAGLSMDRLISARLYGLSGMDLPPEIFDAGCRVDCRLPAGGEALADLVFAPEPGVTHIESVGEVRLTRRRVGRYLGLTGRSLTPSKSLAGAAQSIMSAFGEALAADGLSFVDVVKQQTFYVGGANAEDLYANMRIRNAHYATPGPASTGLAIAGFADDDCRITIELIACRS